ncbi:DUF6949 family protein [Lutibaculum baratangense]|uniref:Uncharacterized protein n=1 Tax=Lutibaculum baratangense AMV1 TaxID=631454 RepID=V4RG79_9HYPH|nr:hypothetical protein [Lutibaculum baratangense]ESR25151.1 hypothetical protein N177_2025 [Lutibaculum baratangense AMV1]
MLFELGLLIYMVAIGFTLAGLATSLYRLVASASLRFDEAPASLAQGVGQTLVLVIGGPVLIAGWVMRWWLVERRSAGVAALGLTLSGFWSFCSGLLLLNIVVSM